MRRTDLEHIIRAAGSIANAPELVIVGSQAILGSFPNPPAELTVSQEVLSRSEVAVTGDIIGEQPSASGTLASTLPNLSSLSPAVRMIELPRL